MHELYQQTILEYATRPRNFGALPEATLSQRVANAACADRFTLHLVITNNTIQAAQFEGYGCALATASASIMTTLLTGQTIATARTLAEKTVEAITTGAPVPDEALAPFAAMHRHPSRIGCATFLWQAVPTLLPAQQTTRATSDLSSVREAIIATLKTIEDPEIMMNIYDLGFIYDIAITADHKVTVTMTLTTPNCPVAESLPRTVAERVRAVYGVRDAVVRVTFDPPWSKDKLSAEARAALGM